jgi:hypothetical protein
MLVMEQPIVVPTTKTKQKTKRNIKKRSQYTFPKDEK